MNQLFLRVPKQRTHLSFARLNSSLDPEIKGDAKGDKVGTEVLDKSQYPPTQMTNAMAKRARFIAMSKPKSIFKYRPVQPINISLPNPKGVEFYEEDVRIGDLPKEAKQYYDYNVKALKQEISYRLQIEHPDLANDTFGTLHNQVNIDYHFKNDDQMSRWQTGCDSDWGEGFSTVKLERTAQGTAMFTGYLDTTVLKNGRIERAGWCTMKSVDSRALNRKSVKKHWEYYNQLLIKCRGDGRSYKVIVYTPGYIDMMWGNCYSYPLHTHGGPYWQYYRIPFSRFFQTVGGRIMDVQRPLPTNIASNIGIVLMDRRDGKFKLEVDYIGVCKDATHNEECAYEGYSIPVYNTNSI
ncbi:unnamed protein product [Bursaphelenchus xylophilus]|uniref:(pine wood nematode) hypothetical protein n=1 Tax=Bursaphelenchus xylophilus TaxID=6326 RepID=A0A1I7RN83_BURXY|nr:unnamed protein product [Bursaphelenchus xylophilus]CAG9123746.1 unnamed protein product [Bursaphelenchus xylophilus]